MRVVGLALTIPVAAFSQVFVGPHDLVGAREAFDRAEAGPQLRCAISNSRPALNFGFRFQTGYVIDIPVGQFHGPGHSLKTLVRVTTEGREPVYLASTDLLPEVPAAKLDLEVAGAFVTGEGTYGVEAMVEDDLHRVCRSRWRIQAKLTGSERDLTPEVPARTVAEVSAANNPGPVSPPGPKIGRLTVLVHAASLSLNASKLESGDVQMLVDSLTSLLEQLPARSVRLVVFNLDQRAVLLRKDAFAANDIDQVRVALNHLQLALVDYRTLQKEDRPVDLLAELLQKESQGPKPPDAVIVMGPKTRSTVGGPEPAVPRQTLTPFFYLQFRPSRTFFPSRSGPLQITDRLASRRGYGAGSRFPGVNSMDVFPPDFPDSIGQLMSRIKGETIAIWNAHDFANAIRRMAVQIPTTSVPEPSLPEPAAEGQHPTDALIRLNRMANRPAPITIRGLPAVALSNAGPAQPDPTEVLRRVTGKVLAAERRAPNYTCVETVTRRYFWPVASRLPIACPVLLERRNHPTPDLVLRHYSTDRLRLDVTLTERGEIFSWVGAAKFDDTGIEHVVRQGPSSTGAFAGFLLVVFQADKEISFSRSTVAEGRSLMEFSFHVQKRDSHYKVKLGDSWVYTGYSGTLLVDPLTDEVVAMQVETAELPAATGECQAITSMDFETLQIGGSPLVLPIRARQRFVFVDGEETENTTSFANCREFLGESTVTFGETAPATAAETGVTPSVPLRLPSGLRFMMELLTPIDSDTAAAGDSFAAKLAGPLRDANRKLLAAAGSLVEGRLLRVQRFQAPRASVVVSITPETLEINGSKVPLIAVPDHERATWKKDMKILLPNDGEGQAAVFQFPGEHVTIKKGFRSNWRSISSGDAAEVPR